MDLKSLEFIVTEDIARVDVQHRFELPIFIQMRYRSIKGGEWEYSKRVQVHFPGHYEHLSVPIPPLARLEPEVEIFEVQIRYTFPLEYGGNGTNWSDSKQFEVLR